MNSNCKKLDIILQFYIGVEHEANARQRSDEIYEFTSADLTIQRQ